MVRTITMRDGLSVAKRASADIVTWLRRHERTVTVQNVEDDARYQCVDVDLLWLTTTGTYKIEIKGDRWHQTGNFFFETTSNKEKGTPGCFMYTQADYVFYYFVVPRVLYVLPMPDTREWFCANMHRFRERSTTTPAGSGFYTTVGRLVPVQAVLREVQGARKEQL